MLSLSGPARLMLSPIFSELHWFFPACSQMCLVTVGITDHLISQSPASSQTSIRVDSYLEPPAVLSTESSPPWALCVVAHYLMYTIFCQILCPVSL